MEGQHMTGYGMLSRKSLVHWLELLMAVVLCAGVLVLINYIAFRHDRRFDLTPAKTYTLAPQTVRVLESLSADVSVTIFYRSRERREFQDLLDLFARASRRFHYGFIDLEKNPARAEMLGITNYGAGIVEYQGKREKINYLTEENLLSALIRLTEKGVKTVRFVTGHGEKDIGSYDEKQSYSMVRQALEMENYKVEDLLLMQQARVPEDTLVLVVSGPQKDLFQEEIDKIETFLQQGGRLLLLCDPFPLPRLEGFLERFHIRLAHDFVLDTKSKLVALDHLTPIIIPDKQHPLARFMKDVVIFPICRSVVPTGGRAVEVFAEAGPESWAERDTQTVYDNKARYDAGPDLQGPVPVAVAAVLDSSAEGALYREPGRLIVMGDSDFAANHYLNILGNKDFFLNAVNWLSEKHELLAARTKTDQTPVSILFLTENEARLVLLSAVVVEPGIILLIGIGVMLWRRIKR